MEEKEKEIDVLEEDKEEHTIYSWSVDINYEIFQFRQTLKEGEPERNLYLAVVLQALLDATYPTTTCSISETNMVQSQAEAWFFSSVSSGTSDFEYVCDMAGLSPSYTRSFAYKILKSKEITFIRKRINALLS